MELFTLLLMKKCSPVLIKLPTLGPPVFTSVYKLAACRLKTLQMGGFQDGFVEIETRNLGDPAALCKVRVYFHPATFIVRLVVAERPPNPPIHSHSDRPTGTMCSPH